MRGALIGWYRGNPFGAFAQANRMEGPSRFFYWMLIVCNVLVPQLLWIKSIRGSPVALWVIAIVVNIGMWLERFIIVMSLHRDFLPSSWGLYSPTVSNWATFIGAIGLFLSLLFLSIRFLPLISLFD